jgi:WhiB family redox-sensing transcriptional regulator
MRYITTNDTAARSLRGVGDRTWQVHGACYGLSVAESERLYFPTRRALAAIDQAKQMCAGCPVRQDCFSYAIDNELRHGIWGGLTEAERRPWHAKASRRLDYGRVHAAINGRDVALSTPERKTVIRHIRLRGWSAQRLANLLKRDLAWVKDELREAGYDITARDRYWELYGRPPQGESEACAARAANEKRNQAKPAAEPTQHDTTVNNRTPPAPDADPELDEDADQELEAEPPADEASEIRKRKHSPVTRQVHTTTLIAALRKAV